MHNVASGVATRLDEHYHLNDGKYMTMKQLHREYPSFHELDDFLQFLDEHVNPLLDERGLPPFNTVGDYLDHKFVAMVNVMIDPSDKRSDAAKLKERDLTTRWWNGCLRRKANREYYQTRVEAVFQESLPDAKRAVASLINDRDLQAIKYYNEWTGAFAPQANEVQNLQLLVRVLMEVLARHVSSDVLAKVAEEIERTQPQLTQGTAA